MLQVERRLEDAEITIKGLEEMIENNEKMLADENISDDKKVLLNKSNESCKGTLKIFYDIKEECKESIEKIKKLGILTYKEAMFELCDAIRESCTKHDSKELDELFTKSRLIMDRVDDPDIE